MAPRPRRGAQGDFAIRVIGQIRIVYLPSWEQVDPGCSHGDRGQSL